MKPDNSAPWFPAKKYGWGWGPPTCWQGWVVMIIWLISLTAGGFLLMPDVVHFIAWTILLSIALTIICYLKGEKPRWRSGND
jgi:hypothetical protein